jgi:phosphoribosylglycinamide formyltransferase-1
MKESELRIGLLISGSGTTAEAVIKACQQGKIEKLKPAVAISSCREAPGIQKTKALGIPTFIVERKNFPTVNAFGEELLTVFKDFKVDLISQNGWLPLTPPQVVEEYFGKIINQHPGPLDPGRVDFGGQGMYGARVTCARLAYIWMTGKDFWTESTIHHVTTEYDKGDLVSIMVMEIPPIDYPKTTEQLQYSPQQLIETTKEVQTKLLPLEHHNVITTLKRFSNERELPGFKRPQPLIPPENKHLVDQAKNLAIKLFPGG